MHASHVTTCGWVLWHARIHLWLHELQCIISLCFSSFKRVLTSMNNSLSLARQVISSLLHTKPLWKYILSKKTELGASVLWVPLVLILHCLLLGKRCCFESKLLVYPPCSLFFQERLSTFHSFRQTDNKHVSLPFGRKSPRVDYFCLFSDWLFWKQLA